MHHPSGRSLVPVLLHLYVCCVAPCLAPSRTFLGVFSARIAGDEEQPSWPGRCPAPRARRGGPTGLRLSSAATSERTPDTGPRGRWEIPGFSVAHVGTLAYTRAYDAPFLCG